MLGSQIYGPYGTLRYITGNIGTAKGFTGQYNDSVTGLDYYNARYYDPVVGVFLSADTVQGNGSGMNLYGYVGGNPETYIDPTGERFAPPPCGPDGCSGGGGGSVGSAGGGGAGSAPPVWQGNLQPFLTGTTGTSTNTGACNTAGCRFGVYGDAGSVWEKVGGSNPLSGGGSCMPSAMGGFSVLNCPSNFSTGQAEGVWVRRNLVAPLTMCTLPFSCDEGTGSSEEGGSKAEVFASDEGRGAAGAEHLGSEALADCGAGLSFVAATRVATMQGERTIGSLHPGDKVWAYNPQTRKMELQPILHVWINHDHDLVDLTITTATREQQSKATKKTSEVIHTNKKHPFLTTEKGFLPVGQIKIGMHVVEADGQVGVITGWKLVPGMRTMYNLTVAQDHTFVVGVGQWIVHNCTDNPAIDSSQQYNRSLLGRTPSPASTEQVLARDPECVYCGNPSEVADHEPSLQQRWINGEYDRITEAEARADADNPDRMVGSCVSCNSSKAGSPLAGENDGWNWEFSPDNMRKLEGL